MRASARACACERAEGSGRLSNIVSAIKAHTVVQYLV